MSDAGVSIHSQEFKSSKSCEQAKILFLQSNPNHNNSIVKAFCTKK